MIDGTGLIVDSFAGGGGASMGIEMALGRSPDIAINHDAEAIAMHAANHPATKHFTSNIWRVDPLDATGGKPVSLAWFSPDCKHFSKAKGGKPVEKHIRDLAWVVVMWAKRARPKVILLENVEEFADWGPLLDDGLPCPDRRGFTFRRWVNELRKLGYKVEWREIRACDFGAPTIRKRLFLIARCDGMPITWPTPTHGTGLLPYRTAAEIIDWSVPCPSIFLTRAEGRAVGVNRPLAPATMSRIAKGLKRYVIDAAKPFIVRQAQPAGTDRSHLVAAFLAQHNGGMVGHDARKPLSTLTLRGTQQQVVAASLVNLKGSTRRMSPADVPAPTQTSGGWHIAEVRAFLIKYYGTAIGQDLADPAHTVTSRDRIGLVTVQGEPYEIVDIGMRMLTPRELFRAQGFPESYIIDGSHNGKQLTKTAQIRMCGNSVCPPVVAALVRANVQRAVEATSEAA
jgi:DNA (cytosine-5)-methyltransferase 1